MFRGNLYKNLRSRVDLRFSHNSNKIKFKGLSDLSKTVYNCKMASRLQCNSLLIPSNKSSKIKLKGLTFVKNSE